MHRQIVIAIVCLFIQLIYSLILLILFFFFAIHLLYLNGSHSFHKMNVVYPHYLSQCATQLMIDISIIILYYSGKINRSPYVDDDDDDYRYYYYYYVIRCISVGRVHACT